MAEANESVKKARESYLKEAFDKVDFKMVKAENEKTAELEDRIFELLRHKDEMDYNKLVDNVL